jgi:holo-[acyl-carrier protein] synthase
MESTPGTSIDGSTQDRVDSDQHVYRAEFNPDRCGAITVGLDVIEIARVERTLTDFGQRFLNKVFTQREQDRCLGRVPELAARFAAKEATSKALGTGIRGIRWREMEVLTNRRGKPVLVLHGNAAERATALRLVSFDVSLTHSRTDAMAIVVALRRPGEPIGDVLDND